MMRLNKNYWATRVLAALVGVAISSSATGALQDGDNLSRSVHPRKSTPCHTLAVTRTFLGVSPSHLTWRKQDWLRRFQDLRRQGFSEIIIDYTSSAEVELFLRSRPKDTRDGPMAMLAAAAKETGLRVWLGLHRVEAHANSDPVDLPAHLKSRLDAIQERLYPLLLAILSADPNNRVFKGWYLPDTIDAAHWVDPDRHKFYAEYLTNLHALLDRLQPSWPIMLSARLPNASIDASRLIDDWAHLTQRAGADVLLVDFASLDPRLSGKTGANPGHGQPRAADAWLALISASLEKKGVSIGAAIRLFSIVADGKQAKAASFSKLRESIRSVREYGREPLTVFPIPVDLVDANDLTAKTLRKRWNRDQKACRGSPSRLATQRMPLADGQRMQQAQLGG